MTFERTSVGLDVHARSVVEAAIDGETGEVTRGRLVPDAAEVLAWVRRLPGPAAVAYEAGPTGFGLYRSLSAAGIDCTVAAPSKLVRPAGDRVKTDAKDALLLARLLRMGRAGRGRGAHRVEGGSPTSRRSCSPRPAGTGSVPRTRTPPWSRALRAGSGRRGRGAAAAWTPDAGPSRSRSATGTGSPAPASRRQGSITKTGNTHARP